MNQEFTHIHNFLPPLLNKNLQEILSLCQKHYLRYLYVIGSVLQPDQFREDSDVDFVFAFFEGQIEDEHYNPNLLAFWDALESLLERKVDLIHGPSLKNPFLIEEIEEKKLCLYDPKSKKVSVGHP